MTPKNQNIVLQASPYKNRRIKVNSPPPFTFINLIYRFLNTVIRDLKRVSFEYRIIFESLLLRLWNCRKSSGDLRYRISPKVAVDYFSLLFYKLTRIFILLRNKYWNYRINFFSLLLLFCESPPDIRWGTEIEIYIDDHFDCV